MTEGNTFTCVYRFLYSNAIYHTEQQKSLKSYSKNAIGVKKAFKKKVILLIIIGNEIKICSQNKCHHHLSNVCENSFRMFHSNWVISDYHSFVWQFEFPWLNLTFILATDFDFIAYDYEQNWPFFKLFSRQWRFWNMIQFQTRSVT